MDRKLNSFASTLTSSLKRTQKTLLKMGGNKVYED